MLVSQVSQTISNLFVTLAIELHSMYCLTTGTYAYMRVDTECSKFNEVLKHHIFKWRHKCLRAKLHRLFKNLFVILEIELHSMYCLTTGT